MLYFIQYAEPDSRKVNGPEWRHNLVGYTLKGYLYAYCKKNDHTPDLYCKGKYYYWEDDAFKKGLLFE